MAKTIEQVVKFPATAAELYDLYMDSEQHSAATNAPAKLSREVGGSFTCHGDFISGRNLALVPGRMIVQAWRGKGFASEDLDSVLILTFRDVEGGAELHMTHANVPDSMVSSLKPGWNAAYWDRWQAYLANRKEA